MFSLPKIHVTSLQHLKCCQIRAYTIKKENVAHFSQYISVKVKEGLGNSEAEFREKLRKLMLRQNIDFLIKKRVFSIKICLFMIFKVIPNMS